MPGIRPIPFAPSTRTPGSGRPGPGILASARRAFPGATPTGSGIARPDPRGSRASLFRVVVYLNRQVPDHLGHRRRLVHDWHGAGVTELYDMQLVVERATRLQQRPGLARPPRG